MRSWIAVLISWLFLATSALAENRLALVIGNDGYKHIAVLQKARADAKSYAGLLREKGYSVQEGYDLGFLDMQAAVAQFIERIQPGDTAVFVYSGHGWSDGSTNYVVGVDVPDVAGQELLARVSLPIRNGLTGVLDDFARKAAGLKVAIIDACRDNPFHPPPNQRGYGLSRGLKPQSVEGSFVIYSAGEGQTALDGLSGADADPNSVFARTLLPLLRVDLPLTEAIKLSQEKTHALAASADHNQTPAYYDEVLGNACLSRACKSTNSDPDEAVAEMTIDAATSADFLAPLIAKLPDGPLKERAKARAAALKATQMANLTPRPPKPSADRFEPDETVHIARGSGVGSAIRTQHRRQVCGVFAGRRPHRIGGPRRRHQALGRGERQTAANIRRTFKRGDFPCVLAGWRAHRIGKFGPYRQALERG